MKIRFTVNSPHGKLAFAVPVEELPERLRERLLSYLRLEVGRRVDGIRNTLQDQKNI